MWNKQRYCWQLQNRVWIQNFRRSNWKITMFGKYVYFFVVPRYGRACQELCGTILSVGKQDGSTTLQSFYSMHRWPEEMKSVGEVSQVCSQIVLNCMYLTRIGRLDILWTVNKLARWIQKWTKACDKRLSYLIFDIHHTCEYKQYCHVGNTAKQCTLGLFQDSDFAGYFEDSKSTSGGTLCVSGSHTFVPISWTCLKQTSVSHSSTESEIIFHDIFWITKHRCTTIRTRCSLVVILRPFARWDLRFLHHRVIWWRVCPREDDACLVCPILFVTCFHSVFFTSHRISHCTERKCLMSKKNHFLGRRIGVVRHTHSWLMGSDRCSSWKHKSEPSYRTGRFVKEQTWSLFSHDSQTQAISVKTTHKTIFAVRISARNSRTGLKLNKWVQWWQLNWCHEVQREKPNSVWSDLKHLGNMWV